MRAYRIETTIEQDGELALHALPLKAGEAVEVIILAQAVMNGATGRTKASKSRRKIKRLNTVESGATGMSDREQALAEIHSGLFAQLLKPGDPLPSEEFARRKAEEKALEERRWAL
jgi:hypothetical protein